MLLISDIDGTLTGDGEALKLFKQHWLEDQLPRGSVLCYNTARSKRFFEMGLRSGELPELLQPDVLIVGEGTEIWLFDATGAPRLCEDWDRHVRQHWSLERVAAAMDPLDEGSIVGINDGEDLRHSITVLPEKREAVATALREALGEHYDIVAMNSWVPGVDMVTAVPAAAGKGNAAMFLRSRCGFLRERTMWAGDTKGDASFLRTDIQGVVVRNASLEFLSLAANCPGRVLLAWGRSAFGVLEGMKEFGVA